MKICNQFIDILVSVKPLTYKSFVTIEHGQKVLYVKLLKAIYNTLKAILLFYKKLKRDFEENRYKINPYDPCVANKIINSKQYTIMWHVDDLIALYVDPKVNNNFIKWVQIKYKN